MLAILMCDLPNVPRPPKKKEEEEEEEAEENNKWIKLLKITYCFGVYFIVT